MKKSLGRKICLGLGSLLGLGVLICLLCLGLILSKINEEPSSNQHFGTILVLGSQILPDGQPAQFTRERLQRAVLLADENPQAKIIVSGAKGADEPVSEAVAMRNWLVAHSVSADRIILEKKASDTSENIAFSKKYFHDKTILVTNDFHLYRALYLAKRENVHLAGAAAPSKIKRPLVYTGVYGHEILGLLYAFVFGKG